MYSYDLCIIYVICCTNNGILVCECILYCNVYPHVAYKNQDHILLPLKKTYIMHVKLVYV